MAVAAQELRTTWLQKGAAACVCRGTKCPLSPKLCNRTELTSTSLGSSSKLPWLGIVDKQILPAIATWQCNTDKSAPSQTTREIRESPADMLLRAGVTQQGNKRKVPSRIVEFCPRPLPIDVHVVMDGSDRPTMGSNQNDPAEGPGEAQWTRSSMRRSPHGVEPIVVTFAHWSTVAEPARLIRGRLTSGCGEPGKGSAT